MSNTFADTTLFFDIESHSADLLWDLPPEEFFRLGQYAWGEGDVVLTEDLEEMRSVIRRANRIVGHNITSFDLTAIFGKESMEPLHMAAEGKVLDTFLYVNLVNPAPDTFTDREGRKFFLSPAKSPVAHSKRWLSLAEQCHQLGIEGKHGNLRELAKKYNPPKTKVADLDYSLIPLDDPEFREYAYFDVVASRELTRALFNRFGRPDDYAWREMFANALFAQVSRNGIKVDREKAQARVDELARKRDEIMAWLVQEFGMPTEGKMPWRSAEGKEAILAAFASFGLTPDNPKWEKTATGAPSLGGENLLAISQGTEAEALGTALAELQGQRSLAQLALDSIRADGLVHPDITSLQRSGRSSVTEPSLTTWSARDEVKSREKEYFVARPGHKFLEVDYSAADARIVAAYSGDTEFTKRFDPGADSHEISGRLMYGDEVYDSDPKGYRVIAKALGHAYAYRAGAKKLALTSGLPLETAQAFVDAMDAAYPKVRAWQDRVTREGERGYVVNEWGRKMPISDYWDAKSGKRRSRSYTQSPAMYGQSGTTEILRDALMTMYRRNPETIRWVKSPVHDAIWFEVPEGDTDWAADFIIECMETEFHPIGGQNVKFTVDRGPWADNWYEAGH